jgi:trehalose 6-phosphate synthase complex regulatory subunit
VITQTAQAFVTSFLTRCIRAGLEHIHPNLSTVPSLSTARHLLPRYKHSRKRLLLLDWEGTLVPRRVSSHMTPSPEVVQLLTKITQDDKNEVWILSGLPVKGVLDSLTKEVPKIGIVYVFSIDFGFYKTKLDYL